MITVDETTASEWEDAAAAAGVSLEEFIRMAVREVMGASQT